MAEVLKEEQEQPNKRRKRILLVTLLFVLAGVSYGIYYATVLSKREDTDNAYVSGNLVTLTSQVSGTVTEIRADETQFVKSGEVLVRLDPIDAKVALAQASAKLGDTVRQLRKQYADAVQYDALIKQRKIDFSRAKKDLARRMPLAADQTVSVEEISHAKEAVENAKAALVVAEKQKAAAHASIDSVDIKDNPKVLLAKADFEQAWLAVKRDAIVAPVSGYVAKRAVQIGSRINPGESLLSIVPLDQLWVEANFKESELRNIRIGQTAKIIADIYGSNVVYHGKIVGLAVGTGSAFSLLPAQNATGNWIKVVQRVPVRIQLDKRELADHPLRVGLSTTVEVDTKDRSGGVLAAAAPGKALFSTKAFTQPMQEAEKLADKIITQNLGG